MPELPEVQIIASQLDEALKGKVIQRIDVLREKSFPGEEKDIIGKTIAGVGRRAKVIVFWFEGGGKLLTVHLKMTGQLIYTGGGERIAGGHPTADWVKKLPSKHTRVVIGFDDGSRLYFNDMRVFGWMRLVNDNDFARQIEKQAPDVTDKEFTADYLQAQLKGARTVKLVLMDQSKIGGVGNIYANDALYKAGIDPRRPAKTVTREEGKKLWKAVREVIDLGIKMGGASASDEKYVNASGLGGKYQEHFLVYDREGEKCRRCQEEIKKIKLGGRGTYFCPGCQK